MIAICPKCGNHEWNKEVEREQIICPVCGERWNFMKKLALTCSEKELRRRMTEGRGITDEGWIQSSVDYNNYFKTHEWIGETRFETLDTENRSVEEVASDVLKWLENNEGCELAQKGEI